MNTTKGLAPRLLRLSSKIKSLLVLPVANMASAALSMRYDIKTGERKWRRYTIPTAGEKGVETWAGDSWKTGGGPAWVTGSYDPEQNLLYWATGNPSPDWNGDNRKGDNLYTNSVLALDPDTGDLKWHFQFTPA